jgi:hypothetical protein
MGVLVGATDGLGQIRKASGAEGRLLALLLLCSLLLTMLLLYK